MSTPKYISEVERDIEDVLLEMFSKIHAIDRTPTAIHLDDEDYNALLEKQRDGKTQTPEIELVNGAVIRNKKHSVTGVVSSYMGIPVYKSDRTFIQYI